MFLEDFPALFPYEISCNFVCSKKNGIPGMWVPVHVPVEFLRSFSSRRVRHIHVMMCNTATIIWYASDQRKIPSLCDEFYAFVVSHVWFEDGSWRDPTLRTLNQIKLVREVGSTRFFYGQVNSPSNCVAFFFLRFTISSWTYVKFYVFNNHHIWTVCFLQCSDLLDPFGSLQRGEFVEVCCFLAIIHEPRCWLVVSCVRN